MYDSISIVNSLRIEPVWEHQLSRADFIEYLSYDNNGNSNQGGWRSVHLTFIVIKLRSQTFQAPGNQLEFQKGGSSQP
jgi:hypothetical protein